MIYFMCLVWALSNIYAVPSHAHMYISPCSGYIADRVNLRYFLVVGLTGIKLIMFTHVFRYSNSLSEGGGSGRSYCVRNSFSPLTALSYERSRVKYSLLVFMLPVC